MLLPDKLKNVQTFINLKYKESEDVIETEI